MAKYSNAKRKEYRRVIKVNTDRTDFICPICKKSHPISQAIVDSPVMNRPDILDVVPSFKVPYYSYRYDESCWLSLHDGRTRHKQLKCTFRVTMFFFCILCGSNIVRGSIEWFSTIVGIICGIIALLAKFFKIKIDKHYLTTEPDFDEALKNNAVVLYGAALSNLELYKWDDLDGAFQVAEEKL